MSEFAELLKPVFDGAVMASNQDLGATKAPKTPAEVLVRLRHEMFVYLEQTDCVCCH